MTGTPDLRRAIRLPHATALVVGTIIGASIFVQPSEVTASVPSVAGVLLVWLVAGALTLIGALVCAELSSIFVRSGGVYVYLTESFGPWLGFLWGWAMFWCMHTGIIAAVATIFARYAGYLVPLGDTGTRLLAVAVVLLLSWINALGIRHGTRLQTAFTVGKLAAIGIIVIVGLALGQRVPEHFVGASAAQGVTLEGFLTALAAGLFAFGGWHMVTYTGDETVNPRRTIPLALLAGTVIVTAAYLLMNTVYLYILPLDQVTASTRVGADLADALLGRGGGIILSVVVMFSTFGALTGLILAGPRVYLAMARDGLAFHWIGTIHPTRQTPHLALVLQAAWASVLVATGTFRTLFSLVIYTEWIFFALLAVGLMRLRRRPDVVREYRIPGYPVLPLVFVVAALGVVANQVLLDPAATAFGLGLVLLGLPVYHLWTRKTPPPEALP